MANKPESRQRLLSILEILKNYSDPERYLTAEEIRLLLQQRYNLDADRRTIRSDLLVLKELGIVEDSSKYARMEDRGTCYIAHPFEAWELKLLIDGIAQTNYFKPQTLDSIIDKVIGLAGVSSRDVLESNRPILDYEVDDSDFYLSQNMDALTKAIKEHCQISFRYFKLNAQKKPTLHAEKHYQVHPYVITKLHSDYYLMGYMDGDQHLRTFRIDRIRELSTLESEKRYPPSRLPIGDKTDELKKYLKNNTNAFHGEPISLEVCWKNSPSILFDVFGVGNVFLIGQRDGEDVLFSIKTREGEGLYANLRRLGPGLKILSPKRVGEQYLEHLKQMLVENEDE